jgi:predicted NAD-dependent protein-ADP-ribosyltransferase YbiA (DUF1768 family)
MSPFTDGNYSYKSFLHAYYPYFVISNPNHAAQIYKSKSIEDAQAFLGVDKLLVAESVSKHEAAYDLAETYLLIKAIMTLRLLADKNMRRALMATAGSQLMMCNEHDNVLGVGKAWLGMNLAGKALMELRDEYISRGGLNAPEFLD